MMIIGCWFPVTGLILVQYISQARRKNFLFTFQNISKKSCDTISLTGNAVVPDPITLERKCDIVASFGIDLAILR